MTCIPYFRFNQTKYFPSLRWKIKEYKLPFGSIWGFRNSEISLGREKLEVVECVKIFLEKIWAIIYGNWLSKTFRRVSWGKYWTKYSVQCYLSNAAYPWFAISSKFLYVFSTFADDRTSRLRKWSEIKKLKLKLHWHII